MSWRLTARPALIWLTLSLTFSGLAAPAPDRQVVQADLLLVGGRVHTMDTERRIASAVAVAGNRIAFVGTDEQVRALAKPGAREIDLRGAMVLPGFHDSHMHPVKSGIELMRCDLSVQRTVDELMAAITACHRKQPDGWLVGSGWDLSLFAEGNPSKAPLDAISDQRPIFMSGADGHSSWVNSRALREARIDSATPNPSKGVIERDAHGEPSGTLRESAQALVSDLLPKPTPAEQREGLRLTLKMAHQFGITSMIDAAADAGDLATYRDALARDSLPIRMVVSLRYEPDRAAETLKLLDVLSRGDARLAVDAVKIFEDGVLEGETAALLTPYARGGSGELNLEPETLIDTVIALDAAGAQVHVHAIGDRAARAALDAFQGARAKNGVTDNRHHIAHLQLVHPNDYPRFAELNVTANFQALWAFPDDYITGINLPAVGAERVERMYPIASIEHARGRIAGGSDWSVSSMNPLDAIQVAVTRRDPSGNRTAVLNAKEGVSLDTMLAAYTVNGAYLAHREALTGTVEPGKLADLVVLERDLFTLPVQDIAATKVRLTIFDGNIVYDAKEQSR